MATCVKRSRRKLFPRRGLSRHIAAGRPHQSRHSNAGFSLNVDRINLWVRLDKSEGAPTVRYVVTRHPSYFRSMV
jgi:hypothetical protein